MSDTERTKYRPLGSFIGWIAMGFCRRKKWVAAHKETVARAEAAVRQKSFEETNKKVEQ